MVSSLQSPIANFTSRYTYFPLLSARPHALLFQLLCVCMCVRTRLAECVCLVLVYIYIYGFRHTYVDLCTCVWVQSVSRLLPLLLQQIRHPVLSDVSYFLRFTAQIFNNTYTFVYINTHAHYKTCNVYTFASRNTCIAFSENRQGFT